MITLVITADDTTRGSIGCSFEEGIGLYELFEHTCAVGRQFVVQSVMHDDLSEEFPSRNLISSFSSNPYGFKYIFR